MAEPSASLVTDQEVNYNLVASDQTSSDVNQRCLRFCQQFSGHIWTRLSPDQIKVTKIDGGFSNILYLCSVSPEIEDSQEGTDIVIKFFGSKNSILFDQTQLMLTDHIVSLLMSRNKMGPRLIGLSPEGQIMEFVKHHHFNLKDQCDIKTLMEVARKLARFHSEEVPLHSQPKQLLRLIQRQRDYAYEKDSIDEYIAHLNLVTLQSNNLDREFKWIEEQIALVDSPVCFIHNDFRKPNIMVLEDINNNIDDQRVLFCDFEASGYGYRGRDFGTFFVEWDRKIPEDYGKVMEFPSNSVIKFFIDEYIRESIIVRGIEFLEDQRNCWQHILEETKFFALVTFLHMVTACLYIQYDGVPKDRLMMGAEVHYQNYFKLKNQFFADNTFTSLK